MKGNEKVLTALNGLLASELSAISQYVCHAQIVGNWGYGKLESYIMGRAREEMKHAEKLIERIIFLEGFPVVDKLAKIFIGDQVPAQLSFDHLSEKGAIEDYNNAIILCGEERDFATREILESILSDEDRHIDDIENLQAQIEQMGIAIFLSTQN
jgi:bacterioferritin